MEETEERAGAAAEPIRLPAPTASPLVAALGVALLLAGLVTNAAVSAVGLALLLAGAVGWWREVLPEESFEEIETAEAVPERGLRAPAAGVPVAAAENRLRLPVEVPRISSGIAGGVAGAVAMAMVALGYGLLVQGSLWYPINLLAAGALPGMASASDAELRSFHAAALGVGILAHGTISLLVGFLYALILPMLPRRHMLWGGFVAPLLWTGVVWAVLGIVDPTLDSRIDWLWFIASQLAFGLAAGLVVARSEPVPTPQTRGPLTARELGPGSRRERRS